MSLVWNDSMSTGVVEVDEQHKELIKRLNQLIEAMSKGKGKSEVESTLKFLDQYVRWHFSEEENCMNRYRCPAALANRLAHERFIKMLETYNAEFQSTGPTVKLVLDAKKGITDWVVDHIVKVDSQLAACVTKPRPVS